MAWLNRNVKLFFFSQLLENGSLENSQDLFVKTKTKTLLFVLEVPQDQDFGIEDYITEFWNGVLVEKLSSL